MFLGIVAVSVVQIILSIVVKYFVDQGMIEKGNIYVNLLLSFLPMYVVCFPLMFLLMKNLPVRAPPQKNWAEKDLSHFW